ncbi:MAG TPA: M42 family peptidase, partial [Thermotogota bacterium]|nr:M42 family peptidase [Thermotogota bacterium]
MSLDTFAALKSLSLAYGPPGREKEVRGLFKGYVNGLVDEVFEDTSGNLIVKRYGQHKGTVFFSAHMDEVCFLVSKVLPEGFLRLEGIGADVKLLPSQKVWIHTRSGKRLRGVIGMLAPHLQTEETRKKLNGFEDLFVDVSMSDFSEISVGDFVTYDNEPFSTGDFFFGKSLDDRACGVIIVKMLERLTALRHDFDVFAAFSSREEIGAFGARTAAYALQPDIGIALDVTHAIDTSPNYPKNEFGKGPVIAVGAIPHRKISNLLIETAKQNGIPYQIEPSPSRTGTDTDQIQLETVAAGVVSLPLRYMHTPYEQICVKDID